ncbi:hypothetical protein VNI00_000825 [Paramarasmius palmivorus]|uniref:Protein-S-isoprenylcysteine O-methyltransferase n=1 Tax=Paramarasmius palmivorus TaxID=297713 RepID=A0AAW0E796_9AGAR
MDRPIYSLFRLPLIAGAAWAINVTMTPPNPPPSPEQRVQPSIMERKLGFSTLIPTLAKVRRIMHYTSLVILIWVFFICESSTIVVGQFRPLQRLPFVTPVSVVASAMALSGGLIRRSCYNYLSKLFTFDLAILPDHRLITSGPYSVVRHPSYSGAILSGVGTAMLFLGTRGSWLGRVFRAGIRKCKDMAGYKSGHFVYDTGQRYRVVWTVILVPRARKEDEMMKSQFGKEWEEWSPAFRWRLVPGIF